MWSLQYPIRKIEQLQTRRGQPRDNNTTALICTVMSMDEPLSRLVAGSCQELYSWQASWQEILSCQALAKINMRRQGYEEKMSYWQELPTSRQVQSFSRDGKCGNDMAQKACMVAKDPNNLPHNQQRISRRRPKNSTWAHCTNARLSIDPIPFVMGKNQTTHLDLFHVM